MIEPVSAAALALLVAVQPDRPIDPPPPCVSVAHILLTSSATSPLIWENGRPVVAIYRMLSGEEFVLSFEWTDGEPCLVDAG